MAYVVLIALICASVAVLPANAKEESIRARVYATESTVGDLTSVTAGQTFTTNFIVNDQATNATLGTIMGFCVALRPQGQPCMCQSTAQLASGTLQYSGLTYLRVPGQPSFDQNSAALLAITGGTGLYTGATGYFQELNPYPGPGASGPAESAAIINVTF